MSVTARIESIGAGGAGVTHLEDGRAAFVHRTAPGDLVELGILQEKQRWVRGRLLRVVEAGPGRRPAPCPHYERCGGCTLEHLEYDAQRAAKAAIVAAALHRIGGLADIPVPEVVAAPAEFRYRNRVSFTLRRIGGERIVAGFHELERADRLLDITGACLLPEPILAEAWDALRAGWGAGARRLPGGRMLRLTLRATAHGAVTLLIEGGTGRGLPTELLAAVPQLRAIWERPVPTKPARLLAGESDVIERWGDLDLELSGALFLQVNRAAARLLEAHVLERAIAAAPQRVIDAYCGIGVYARELSERGDDVVGIELDPHAIAVARQVAPRARFHQDRVEEALGRALPADLVIVNPPRGGLDPAASAALLAQPPARLIYVSCDPATLARDAERLAPALQLRAVRCFDLFPQTAHVETVAEFA